jgi:hypothetical protein
VEQENNEKITRLTQLCSEWKARSEMKEEEYKIWLPDFHTTVVEERGGLFALFFTYCDYDIENDPANGQYRCLYPLFPIGSGGVALITRDVNALEHEIEKFLAQMSQ